MTTFTPLTPQDEDADFSSVFNSLGNSNAPTSVQAPEAFSFNSAVFRPNLGFTQQQPVSGITNSLQELQNQSLQQIDAGGLALEDLNEFGLTNEQLQNLDLDSLGSSVSTDQLARLQAAQQDLVKNDGGRSLAQIFFGSKDQETGVTTGGAFAPVASAVTGIGQLALGFKQLGQSERALDFQQDAFERNFAAQEEAINNRLADREYRRLRRSGVSHQDATVKSQQHADKFGVGQRATA